MKERYLLHHTIKVQFNVLSHFNRTPPLTTHHSLRLLSPHPDSEQPSLQYNHTNHTNLTLPLFSPPLAPATPIPPSICNHHYHHYHHYHHNHHPQSPIPNARTATLPPPKFLPLHHPAARPSPKANNHHCTQPVPTQSASFTR